jgi:hypothetical protein
MRKHKLIIFLTECDSDEGGYGDECSGKREEGGSVRIEISAGGDGACEYSE